MRRTTVSGITASSITTLTAGLISAVLLSGCMVGPKYKRPNVQAPDAFHGADGSTVASPAESSIGDKKWAEVFSDPDLQVLIRTALTDNFDVRVAAQRILEQEQQVRITRAAQFPQVTGGGSGIGASIPNSVGSGIDSPLSFGGFNLGATWTPDFWGLYRRQTEAARAQLLGTRWAERAVKMTLVQNVATSYLQLRALDRQLAITRQTLSARQDSVKLTTLLEHGGSAPLSDLRQAEQLLYQATSQIPQLEQQVQQQENAINLLLGRNPGAPIQRSPAELTPPPQEVPVGMPSQLLERRPDIQQAEAQLVAANAQIGAARAQLFPQLSITGSAGIGGDSFESMFTQNSLTTYGIGSLTQPIFMGGKLRGQIQLSKEQEKEMLVSYQKTIAGAFRDVSNALIAEKKQHEYRVQQEKLVAAAQDAVRLAHLRYNAGSTAYLEVLTNETNLYSAQLSLVTAQQNEALTIVQLYSALGGGWQ